MAGAHEITVTVVVSGARVGVTAKEHEKVAHLIREALKEAGIPHPKVEDWTLRSADGGGAIDPDLKVKEAGIADGATLFLDPDEGGGGEAVVALDPPTGTEPPVPPLLVDPAVSEAKLARQLADWEANAEVYRERGWQLQRHEGLEVDVAFTARLPIGPMGNLVVIPLAVTFDFHNYDVWAPSVRVIDPLTRRWLELPRVRAIDFEPADGSEVPLDLFVNNHPETGHVFLCKAGTREYHTHFEHSGDDWLLYRDQGFGTIGRLCDLLWRTAVKTIAGINIAAQRAGLPEQAEVGMGIDIRQEKPEDPAQQQMLQPIPIGQLPPQMLAQLPPEIQALVGGQG
jgi:hypothetical protein